MKLIRPSGGILIALLGGAIMLMWLLKTCSSANRYAAGEPHKSGGDTIDVAIQYSPLALYSYADTLGGFSYELLKALAEQEGIKLKFHPIVTLEGVTDHLEKTNYNIIVANIPRTDNFDSRFRFTEPIYLDRLVLVQQKQDSTRVKSQLDLAGREVWVPAQSPAATRLRNLAREIETRLSLWKMRVTVPNSCL